MPENIDKEQGRRKDSRRIEQKDAIKQNTKNESLENNMFSIVFTNQNLMQAVIYSEVLGKPRCKRRGRWR